jgi:hypothetical protein
MSDNVRTFCNDIHDKLSTLESRMESLKRNTGPSWHQLQEKLNEVRARGEARRPSINQLRAKLKQWCDDKQSELSNSSESGKNSCEAGTLAERAQRAEDHARIAIEIAEASIDEAERMILEAISAWLDVESVGNNDGNEDLSPEVRHSMPRADRTAGPPTVID